MAYNSDGYIMIDFTEVDFRRTNQTIDGLYKRCVDVIGTNKFILVINANGRTPLPATCSFTNNQYVIDTVIYMFAVSSNDNLFIRRNDVPASDIIDDTTTSVSKTWSSSNIVNKLAPIDSATGASVTFKTSLPDPILKCEIAINATQEGSGDPSPSNVRPIHGFSEVNIYQRGINQWDEETENGVLNTTTGANQVNNTALRTKNYIRVLPNTSYYCSALSGSGYAVWCMFYDNNKNVIAGYSTGKSTYANASEIRNASFVTPSNCAYIRFYMTPQYGATYNSDVSINYPSTDTDYHAYTGNTYTIQLGQEVYGAEVDVVNGVAHCTHRYIDFNITEFITYSSGTLGIYYCSTGGGAVGYNGNNLCSCFKKSSANNVGGMDDLSFVVREGAIYLRNLNYVDDLSGFTDSVKNNSMIIELSTPITIPLTPTQIETLIGNNTIFADTGDTTVYYRYLPIDKI